MLTDEKRRLLKLIEPWGGVNETEETGRGQASVDYANQKSATKGLSAAASLRNTLAYFVIVHYIPMYGVQIAFKDFKASKGIWESQWVGLKWFRRFFFLLAILAGDKKYAGFEFLQILLGFPVPILLAILLNQVRNQRFRKFVQSVVYSPHFISIVVLAGMLYIFLSPRNGFVNTVIKFFGGQPIFFWEAKYFKITFVLSGIWQHAGWSAIIYIAALAGIQPRPI